MSGDARDALDDVIESATRETAAEAGRVADPGADDGRSASVEEEQLRRDLAALNDRHLRLAAEFDNYRKRTERERAETWGRAQAELAAGLLDILDDLQRVAHVTPDAATAGSVLEGVQLVERKLLRALGSAGLEEVEAEGERFDPTSMEALTTVDAERAEEDDTVADVFQKGYRFKGQLLRPARVRVRKYHG